MPNKIVIVTGGTGFIGRRLVARLTDEGYAPVIFTRNETQARSMLGDHLEYAHWSGLYNEKLHPYFEKAHAIINLAGESIGSRPWSESQRARVLGSRTNAGEALVQGVTQSKHKPHVFIQASAIGFYPTHESQPFDELSPSHPDSFVSHVVQKWEASTLAIEQAGVRRVIARIGVVLGNEGGALNQLRLPFRFFVGGHLGNGKQWFSWVHVDDVVQMLMFSLKNETLSGIYNVTAPNPVTMKDFCKTMGKAMGRPSWLHVPAFALRLMFGKVADELILASQKVLPQRLSQSGFKFQFDTAELALNNLLKKRV